MRFIDFLAVVNSIIFLILSACASLGATIPASVGASAINVTPPALVDTELRFVNSYELTLTGLRPNTSGGYSLSDDCGIDGTHWKLECSLTFSSSTIIGNESLSISGKFIHKTAPHPSISEEKNNESIIFSAKFLTETFDPNTSKNNILLNDINLHESGKHSDKFQITSIVGVGDENFFGAKKLSRVKLTFRGTHPVPLPATLPMLLVAVLGIGAIKRCRPKNRKSLLTLKRC